MYGSVNLTKLKRSNGNLLLQGCIAYALIADSVQRIAYSYERRNQNLEAILQGQTLCLPEISNSRTDITKIGPPVEVGVRFIRPELFSVIPVKAVNRNLSSQGRIAYALFGFIDNRKFTNNSSYYNQATGYPEVSLNCHLKI